MKIFSYKINATLLRNLASFWLLGLCNNYGYVIMLSAAEDIMDQQQGNSGSSDNTTLTCSKTLDDRNCSSASTGAVLLADNLPALVVQATFPFFMHRIPFGVRHGFVCLLQIASYLTVAFSTNVAMSLAGVTMASFGQGIGEITYLAMSSFFPASTIAAWSSGTGGAGLIGSFAYAFLTDPSMGDLKPKVALLIMLFIPGLFAIAYWFVLAVPSSVYSPSFHPRTWLIPSDHDKVQPWDATEDRLSTSSQREETLSIEGAEFKKEEELESANEEKGAEPVNEEKAAEPANEEGEKEKGEANEKVPQRQLSFKEKLWHIVPLLHMMIPLALVYMAEYLINQGLTEMIFFSCSRGWNLPTSSQYRWYQVLYQLGVFLSRSSVRFFELPMWAIFLLPVMQAMNLTFFAFEAIYWFVPNIGIMFALIVFEGLLGGSAYVNTYNQIHKTVPADVREYSMSITSVGNSIGTNMAGFLAIPLHNWVCKMPVHNTS